MLITALDERRIAHLMSKFNSTELSSSSTAAGSGSSKATRTADTVYAGGIFSKLEVQFRAQQAAKALAHQTRQAVFENNFQKFHVHIYKLHRSQGSGRKR